MPRQKPRRHDKTKTTLQIITLLYWRRDEFLQINQKAGASITTMSKYGTTFFKISNQSYEQRFLKF